MYHNSIMMRKSPPVSYPPPKAVLLLGPTGSGKTPLGEAAERSGLWGRRCLHFDFGENLRRAAAARRPDRRGLKSADLAVIRRALVTGALLEDAQFPIAARIFAEFLREAHAGPDDLILLNGLPRHAGQARDMDRLVDVIAVVELAAAPTVIRERIRRNAGGDRMGRTDDSQAEIRKKLDIYEKRTLSLVDHYRERGAAKMTLGIGPRMSAETMRKRLERAGRIALFKA
jgi:adenylate kinase family enzyme